MSITLKLTVHKAEGLLNLEASGLFKNKDRKSDPFCTILFKDFKAKTKVIENTLDPDWNEDFSLPCDRALDNGSELTIEVNDYEKVGSSRPLGMAVIRLGQLVRRGTMSQEWFALKPRKSEAATGRIQVSLQYNDPSNPPQGDKDPTGKGGVVTGDADGGDGDQAAGGIVSEGGDEQGDDAGGSSGPLGFGLRNKLHGKVAKRKVKKVTPRTNKVVDWQVRVHVEEAKNLSGSKVDPVVRVVAATTLRKQTRVHKTNSNPVFDEYFVFNFHDSSQKLFDQLVELKVFNARKIFKDSSIGSFAIDIGSIYDEDNHMYPHTWVMLTDPDSGDSSCRGYLKVTLTVLGPGDEAVIPEDSGDNEDFESRVLRPVGAELETIDICFKLFSAEDVPQKDMALQTGVKAIDKFTRQADKMYCDPYAKVTFAGKIALTKVIQDTYFPEWNEEIHLMAQIPSMLNKIKFQLWDSDAPAALSAINLDALRAGDDIIATHHFHLDEISSVDADFGFLPTFGPAYVALYGGPRKFEAIYDNYYKRIDEGVGEGFAYRGRVFMEISAAHLGDNKLGERAELIASDIERAKAFLRRIEYYLRLVVTEVSFLNPDKFSKGDLVFEVSIGMIGNTEASTDDNPLAVASTTYPSTPVPDGCHYRMLAWDNKKPCIEIRSEWEDVMFRICNLNLYRNMILRIVEASRAVEELVQPTPSGEVEERKVDQARDVLLAALTALLADCARPQVPLPESISTPLDRKVFEKRDREKVNAQVDINEQLDLLQNRQITVQECLATVRNLVASFTKDAVESQTCIPDITLWLIHKGDRVAYCRFPVADHMWSKNAEERGPLFGKSQSVFLKAVTARPKKLEQDRAIGQIQLRVMFGPRASLGEWPKLMGQPLVLAETYENQRFFPLKGWGDVLLPTDPPKFSDKRGKDKLLRDTFKEPEGWAWNNEWYVDPDLPDLDIYGDQDLVVIEVFENERKQPIVGYCKTLLPTDPPSYSDRAGSEKRLMEEVELPKGWMWRSAWQMDMTRAVDKDGWEYSPSWHGDFHAGSKRLDFVRRRRWFIERVKDPAYKGETAEIQDPGEGWLYAIDFGHRFKPSNSTMDAVRRRRWHRELIAARGSDKTLADLPTSFPAAGTFFAFKGQCKYQFRAHLYQGRDLPAEDGNAFSDPFAFVSFVGASARTIVIEKTVSPAWDQTLAFEVTLYGNTDDPRALFEEVCPRVVVEVYDKDAIGDDDFLGRFTATPVFRSVSQPMPGVLAWYESRRLDEYGGEVLAAFEVIPIKDAARFPLPKPVTKKEPLTRRTVDVGRIPEDIRPELEPCEIEVLTWGLRNLRRVFLMTVNRPSIKIECGGVVKETEFIKSMKKFQNFETSIVSFEAQLPVKEIYAPPLNILVYDNRKFGSKPLVGSVSLKSLKMFRASPGELFGEIDFMKRDQRGATLIASSAEEAIPVQGADVTLVPPEAPAAEDKTTGGGLNLRQTLAAATKSIMKHVHLPGTAVVDPDDTIDWWNKFFTSVGEEQTGAAYEDDLIEVYPHPLETRYDFQSIIKSFSLVKGKSGDQEERGVFKGNFRVISQSQQPAPLNIGGATSKKDENGRIPHPWGNLPDKTQTEVLVRVYVVRGLELQPRDSNGKSDPFVVLTFGKNKPINDKKNYIPRNLNPVFGRVYEMSCVLPRDNELLIQVFDYDLIGANDLIGETRIDLEARYLTRKRATVGLAPNYYTEGLCAWRDSQKPSEILAKFCETHLLTAPTYTDWAEGQPVSCTVPELNGGTKFTPSQADLYENREVAKENAALMALHFAGLVRDHVETRTLYDPMQPEMDQGKLQMWLDIFPKADGPPPPPVNITPRQPKKYVLRLVIFNTVEVDFADVAITGEEMSDIYVKGLIRGLEDKREKTDVHYRSLTGEGNFNWRQLFPFDYIPAEERVSIEKRAHLFSSEFEITKVPPILSLQIWDADIFQPDEFIGSIEIELNNMIMPARTSDRAKPKKEGDKASGISLFKKKNVQGWYACTNPENPTRCSGKIELEMELLSVEEAAERPNASGRDEPNQYPVLEPPKRPETSFLWFTSPWKTLKYIIWKHYKWYIIGLLVLIILVVAIVIFIYTAPQSVMQKIVNGLNPNAQ